MKLKIKIFNWIAGRPVVVINQETAKKLNVHVDERIQLSSDGKKINAVVDIFEKIVKNGEIGISHEVNSILKLKNNSKVEISLSELYPAGQIIKKKIQGKKLSKKELEIVISEIVQNRLTEPEIAYFAAAEKLEGMSIMEVINLIKAMVKSGNKLNFNKKIIADKHSIGGIAGNRTSPLVVSICAAAGLTIPKTSSRAITSASGTADVIETIANVEFSFKELQKIIDKINACLAWGGALGLAPSDDKIIHVERILNLDVEPQLLASIMSKKIASGSNHILIDIPYGKSAKVETRKKAEELGKKFKKIAKYFKLKLRVVYTSGAQPIGNGIGPVLEMLDIISVLQNKPYPEDLKKKALFLSSELMKLCKIKNAKFKAKEILESGQAYQKFKEIINAQNNSNDFEKRISLLKPAKFRKIIKAHKSGQIIEIDNKKINLLCRILGTPESKSSGIYLFHHLGKIKKFQPIMAFYSESESRIKDALRFYDKSCPVIIK